MARDIDRKLRLTAAFLGAGGRKELAAAFRRVNADTSFEVARADKWLQGRATPREPQIYEDWAKVVGLDRLGRWIADCDAEAFLDEICARHGRDREALQRDLEPVGKRPGLSSALDLIGTFACYSHAWTIHPGQLLRGELTVRAASGQNRLRGTYTEILSSDSRVEYKGPIVVGKRAMHIEARDSSGDSQFKFSLFLPSPPASVLGGLWSGATVLGPLAQPSVTRVVMVRLQAASERLRTAQGFMPDHASLGEDLAMLGYPVADAATVDRRLREFLTGGIGGGFDQISIAAYHALVELFDRSWLTSMAPDGDQAVGQRTRSISSRPNDVEAEIRRRAGSKDRPSGPRGEFVR
ncbi:MAG: hypothetical protein AB7O82_22470 [Reyranella sp.]